MESQHDETWLPSAAQTACRAVGMAMTDVHKDPKSSGPRNTLRPSPSSLHVPHRSWSQKCLLSCGISTVVLVASVSCSVLWTPPATVKCGWTSSPQLFLLSTQHTAGERRYSSPKSLGCQLPSITTPRGRNNLLLVFTWRADLLGSFAAGTLLMQPSFDWLGLLVQPLVQESSSPGVTNLPSCTGWNRRHPTQHLQFSHIPCSNLKLLTLFHNTFTSLSFYSTSLRDFSLCPWKHLKSFITGRCWNKCSDLACPIATSPLNLAVSKSCLIFELCLCSMLVCCDHF